MVLESGFLHSDLSGVIGVLEPSPFELPLSTLAVVEGVVEEVEGEGDVPSMHYH